MASEPKEDGSMSRKRHKPEEIVAKLRQVAAPGRCAGCPGDPGGGCDPHHRGDRGDVLSLAAGVRRAQVRSGQAHEGAGDREWSGKSRYAHATVSPLVRSSASSASPSVARTNFALARAVAGLAFSACRVFVTSPWAATAIWMLFVCSTPPRSD